MWARPHRWQQVSKVGLQLWGKPQCLQLNLQKKKKEVLLLLFPALLPPAPRFAVLCLRLLFLKGSYGSGEVLLPLWKGAPEEADVIPFVGVLVFTELCLIFWSESLGAYVL